MVRLRHILFALPLAAVPIDAQGISHEKSAERIYVNANVVTRDASQPHATWISVGEGRVLAIGTSSVPSFDGPDVPKIDLHGATVLPGFVDAHMHLASLGAALAALDLSGVKSEDELVAKVAERVKHAAPGAWIEGDGWNQNDWGGGFPTRTKLDRVSPKNPVALDRIDGHAILANSKALALAGIDRNTPDPKGGKILRDKSGEPTGVLLDDAISLLSAKMPAATAEEIDADTLRGQQWCVEHGITEVHDAGVSRAKLDSLLRLEKDGRLKIRVYAMLRGSDDALVGEWLARGPKTDGLVTVRSIKALADGALGSRGAALLADYSDDPGNRGLTTFDAKRVEALAEKAFPKGWQVCVHAIGDRANREVLDAFEHALAKTKVKAEVVRPRVEHAQVVSPEDLPRFAKLHVIASMQPWHVVGDMAWAEARVGSERIRGAYAWRTLVDSGARFAGGSDSPFGGISGPLQGIHAAVTRQDDLGKPAEGWHAGEALSREQAIDAFTKWPAWASFEEDRAGTIAAGHRADFVFLSGDPRVVPANQILSLRILGAVVAGGPAERERQK